MSWQTEGIFDEKSRPVTACFLLVDGWGRCPFAQLIYWGRKVMVPVSASMASMIARDSR